jgi:hypothetical protein
MMASLLTTHGREMVLSEEIFKMMKKKAAVKKAVTRKLNHGTPTFARI